MAMQYLNAYIAKKKDKNLVVKKVYMPKDFTLTIPKEGYKWLRKYGLTPDDAATYCFGYSQSYDRLIMPVYKGDKLMYWSGRNLHAGEDGRSKYHNVSADRHGLMFELWNDPEHIEGELVILTEDILSAIKVHKAGYNAVSLLGTNIDAAMIGKFLKNNNKVIFWLDPDMRPKMLRHVVHCTSLGLPSAAEITSVRDPKEYSYEDIEKFIDPLQKLLDKSINFVYNRGKGKGE